MFINEKLILVDADGVLLDWRYSFDMWMKRHGYVLQVPESYNLDERYNITNGWRMAKIFNESSWIRKLPPHKDAIKYVKKLHEEHGYIFHMISSLSDDEYSQHLRTKNLRELFGDTVFEKYFYLDTDESKVKILEKYKDTECWWVEDKIENAKDGKDLGLKPLLIDQPYNKNNLFDIPVAMNWSEVYNHIVG